MAYDDDRAGRMSHEWDDSGPEDEVAGIRTLGTHHNASGVLGLGAQDGGGCPHRHVRGHSYVRVRCADHGHGLDEGSSAVPLDLFEVAGWKEGEVPVPTGQHVDQPERALVGSSMVRGPEECPKAASGSVHSDDDGL
jgi:hypothetical protein